MKFQAPAGNGLGVQKFSIKSGPGGGLQFDGNAHTPLQAAALATEAPEAENPAPPIAPRPVAPQTPFNRLYPGVDPSKVEMVLDEATKKLRFKPIEAPAEVPVETPAAPVAPVVAAPSEADQITALRAELAQQNQLQTAMLQALMTGRPLMEILSGQPAAPPEPDYSQFDLEDEDSRLAFVKQVQADARAAAKAEAEAQINTVRPSIQDTQRHAERLAVQAAHGKDSDYAQKVALAEQLVGNNPNVSFKATYNLISQIQGGLAAGAAPTKPTGPILTPAQQEAKAAQAARYQSSGGGRANGGPSVPPGVKTFKQHAAWAAQQLALGYSPEEIAAASRR